MLVGVSVIPCATHAYTHAHTHTHTHTLPTHPDQKSDSQHCSLHSTPERPRILHSHHCPAPKTCHSDNNNTRVVSIKTSADCTINLTPWPIRCACNNRVPGPLRCLGSPSRIRYLMYRADSPVCVPLLRCYLSRPRPRAAPIHFARLADSYFSVSQEN